MLNMISFQKSHFHFFQFSYLFFHTNLAASHFVWNLTIVKVFTVQKGMANYFMLNCLEKIPVLRQNNFIKIKRD